MSRKLFALALAGLIGVAIVSTPVLAQVTTGSISGTVTAKTDGSALPGVTVTATHEPTNTNYVAITDANGRFRMVNVRVGGPYTVQSQLSGFQTDEQSDVYVRLGQIENLDISLALEAVTAEIVVTGEAEFINPNRTGSQSNLDAEQIARFPTVRRNILLDGAQTNPYASIRGSDDAQKDISFAGRSSKYNNIQIDGSNYNDLFGLGESGGTPAGQTNSQPIQQDVVQEIQVSVSPYDVRQGGFTGGVINAVTRSGTNDFHGTAYYAKRDPDYVGDGPFDSPVSNFDEKQYGATVGGPILQDKLWFFVAGESNSNGQVSGFSANGTSGQQYSDPAGAARFQNILQNQYGYDPGGLGDIPIDTTSDHGFARLDWNINDKNQFTVRYNLIDATHDDVSNRSFSVFRFPNATFSRTAKTKSTVGQINSTLGEYTFNEGRIGYQTLRDRRDFPVAFPSIEVGGSGPRRGDLIAGTEQFSGLNAIEQDILEIHDDVTLIKGDHTLTLGTHNEFFDFTNFFLASFFGYYYFPTLDDLAAGTATEYQVSFTNGPDPGAASSIFGVSQLGIYGGDQWRVNDHFTLTYGLRADYAIFNDNPDFNPDVLTAFGVDTRNVPDNNLILSPRVGFNWDPNGDGMQQLRGGVGIFAGRTPYVWISNIYAGTGVATSSLRAQGLIPFNPDPFTQPHAGSGGVPTVDLIDPNFEFPQVLRATLGYDRTLPHNLRTTVEMIWSQTQQDVYYINQNKVLTGTNAFDGRPTYSTVSSDFANAPTLTNTSLGEDLSLSVVLSKPAINGLGFEAGYRYMDSNNGFDGGSSRAISNWQFHPTRGDIFHPEEATSSWENKHRYFLNLYYDLKTGPVTHSFGVYYNAEAGRPFSILVGSNFGLDPNGDGFSTNDLLYVPASPDEVILDGFTWDQFVTYLRAQGLSPDGRILDRNELQGPWTRRLDFHYDIKIPAGPANVQVTLDMINLLNLFDKTNGVVRFVPFGTTTPIRITGIDAATGKPIYRQNFNGAITNTGSPFSTSDTLSRWQARLGLRVTF